MKILNKMRNYYFIVSRLFDSSKMKREYDMFKMTIYRIGDTKEGPCARDREREREMTGSEKWD